MTPHRQVAILVFDDVEVLDFAGPMEVFSVAGRWEGQEFFEVYTVAPTKGLVTARSGLKLQPTYSLADCPRPDVLIIPGGRGTRQEMNNLALIDWVRATAGQVEAVLSVCTGSLILAKAGLLDGLSATTHYLALDLLGQIAPRTKVLPKERVVDNGRIITSAGISAGLDASLYLLGRLLGLDMAEQTARYMEYEWGG